MKKNFLKSFLARFVCYSLVLIWGQNAFSQCATITMTVFNASSSPRNIGIMVWDGGNWNGNSQTVAAGQSVFLSAHACEYVNNPGFPSIAFNWDNGNGMQVVGSISHGQLIPSGQTFDMGSFTVNANGTGTTNQPCTTNLTFSVKNSDSVPHHFGISNPNNLANFCPDGSSSGIGVVSAGQTPPTMDVQPGQTGSVTVNVPCSDVGLYKLYLLPQGASAGYAAVGQTGGQPDLIGECWSAAVPLDVTPTGSSPNSSPPSVTATNLTADNFPTPSQYNGAATNSNILWTPQAATNANAAIQQAGSALYDITAKAANQAHMDSKAAQTLLSQINSSIDQQNNSLSNAIRSLIFTNSTGGFDTNADAILTQINDSVGRGDTSLSGISNILSGMTDTNSDISRETTQIGISNLLGQIYGAMTNRFGSGTNAVGNGTNLVGNGTNYIDGLSNVVQETTFENYTNQLFSYLGALSNSPLTNPLSTYYNAAANYASAGSNSFMGLGVNADANTSARYGSEPDWTIQIPYMGNYTIDVNPMHNSMIAAIATFFRASLKWGLILSLVIYNSRSLLAAVNALGATRQASASGQSVFGNNVSFITAIAMAAAITAAMLAVPAFAFAQLQQYLQGLGTSPFSSVSGVVASSVWLADQFFPLAVIVAVPLAAYTFNMSLQGVVWGVQTITRFLVG